MDKIQFLNFKKNSDVRGSLVPVESYKDIPFNIDRLFYIKDMDKFPRGFHSHKKTVQVLVPISGSFSIELMDGFETRNYELKECNVGLLIPRNIWLKMENFSDDCIILVLCSYKYDEEEYIRNFGDFVKYNSELNNKEQIKCFDLSEQTEALRFELNQKISAILDSGNFILGEELNIFESNFENYLGSKYCVGLSNGTSALVCALKALKLKEEDEVIVQSNSYIAAPLAVQLCNLKIKIINTDSNLNIDLVSLEKSITQRTKAVVVVYLYGMSPNMDKLLELKKKYGFYLIEDAAQAHGSSYKNKKLGTFGDIGCFSFYPSKNLGCFGDGGCIVTDNQDYYEYIRRYRNYGSVNKYEWEIKGSNERMDTVQAAILNVKLKYLDEWNEKRNKLADIYNTLLDSIEGITIPQNSKYSYRNYHLYVILVENRDDLIKYLETNNISCAIHYPETFYKSSAFKELNKLNFNSDIYKNKLLSLPMYPELDQNSVYTVCSKIKQFYEISPINEHGT